MDALLRSGLRLGEKEPEAARAVLEYLRGALDAPVPERHSQRGFGMDDAYRIGRLGAALDIVSGYVDAAAGVRTPRELAS